MFLSGENLNSAQEMIVSRSVYQVYGEAPTREAVTRYMVNKPFPVSGSGHTRKKDQFIAAVSHMEENLPRRRF